MKPSERRAVIEARIHLMEAINQLNKLDIWPLKKEGDKP